MLTSPLSCLSARLSAKLFQIADKEVVGLNRLVCDALKDSQIQSSVRRLFGGHCWTSWRARSLRIRITSLSRPHLTRISSYHVLIPQHLVHIMHVCHTIILLTIESGNRWLDLSKFASNDCLSRTCSRRLLAQVQVVWVWRCVVILIQTILMW